VARDAPSLLSCAATHHQRLLDAVAAIPPGDAFADEPIGQRDENAPCPSA
jgi:hypothetical protein